MRTHLKVLHCSKNNVAYLEQIRLFKSGFWARDSALYVYSVPLYMYNVQYSKRNPGIYTCITSSACHRLGFHTESQIIFGTVYEYIATGFS